jgi:hypothetical protein
VGRHRLNMVALIIGLTLVGFIVAWLLIAGLAPW